jgi:hypothetical protein
MDHSCHRCHQPVEDGVPFCANCGAPQIRVLMPDALAANSSGEAAVAAPEYGLTAVGHDPSLSTDRSQALIACVLAGLVAAIAISLRIIEGIGMLSAGFLAVAFYRSRRPGASVKAPLGALLGAMSGAIGFVFWATVDFIAGLAAHKPDLIRQQALDFINQMPQFSTDPQVLATVKYWKTPEGAASSVLFFLFTQLFTCVLVSGLAGIVGAVIFGLRNRRQR